MTNWHDLLVTPIILNRVWKKQLQSSRFFHHGLISQPNWMKFSPDFQMIVLYSNGSFRKNKKLLLMTSLQIKKTGVFFAFLEKVTCLSAETWPKGFTELPWLWYQNAPYLALVEQLE